VRRLVAREVLQARDSAGRDSGAHDTKRASLARPTRPSEALVARPPWKSAGIGSRDEDRGFTGAETAILTVAVVYAWSTTAWGANWLDPDRLKVRLLLVALMFASLLMSVAIGDAFDAHAQHGLAQRDDEDNRKRSMRCPAATSVCPRSTTTAGAFTAEPFELERLLALAIAFTGTVAIWWCYFQRLEAVGGAVAATAEGAGTVGYWGTWTPTLIVLALIGLNVLMG